MIQTGQDALDSPSDVWVVGNRCHDNEEAGILFNSSTGRAENNECWGSRAKSGICIQRSARSPEAPSHVSVVRNRCYGNEGSGIAFFSSRGRAENNECWANHPNKVTLENSPGVVVEGHADLPSFPAETLHRQHLAAKPFGPWLVESLSIGARAEALADFLASGGCRHCFERFWLAPLGAETDSLPDAPVLTAAPRQPTTPAVAAGRIGIYRVDARAGEAAEIRALDHDDPVFYSSQRPAGPGLAGIRAFLPRLGRDWLRIITGKRNRAGSLPAAPRWVMALVSADEAGFDAWLRDEPARLADLACGLRPGARPPALAIRRFDLAGQRGLEDAKASAGFIEAALLRGKPRWRLALSALAALVLMPTTEAMGALFVVAGLFGLTGLGLALAYGLGPGAALPGNAGLGGAAQLLQALAAKLAGDWAVAATLGMLFVLVLLVLANRVLPGPLRIPKPTLDFLRSFLKFGGQSPVEWVNEELAPRIGKGLRALAHSKSSRRLWLRRQLYGFRLFGLRLGPPSVAIVAVCNVDVPSPGQMDDIRAILDACPAEQPLLLIMQMPGLSMLASGFLDVWFAGRCCPAAAGADRAFIVHDPASAAIAPLIPSNPYELRAAAGVSPWSTSAYGSTPVALDRPAGWPDPPATGENKEALRTAALASLANLLGWRAATSGRDEADAIDERGAVLLNPAWAPEELLPTLVIGSAPALPMTITRAKGAFRQYGEELKRAIRPYQAVFASSAGEADPPPLAEREIEAVDACAVSADGLIVAVDPGDGQRRWIGRAGYRVALAAAVRNLYRVAGKSVQEAEKYLAEMMACGEIHHLRALAAGLAAAPGAAGPQSFQRLVLHMEAAVFLAAERLSLLPPGARIGAINEEWSSLTETFRSRPTALPPAQASRICAMLLKQREAWREAGITSANDGEVETELEKRIADPLGPAPDSAPNTTWAGFFEDARTFLWTLANRAPATAGKLMEAKLSQDWSPLPERLREALRRCVAGLPRHCLETIGKAGSAEELLELAGRFRERPALVTAGLGILAAADWRHRDRAGGTAALCPIADALLRLRTAAGNTETDLAIPVWSPHPRLPALPAATELLTHEARLARLCELFAAGATSRQELAASTQDLPGEIEGIVLGVHGELHRALKMAKEVDERFLLSA